MDLKNKIYLQIKTKRGGSKELALSPNQDETRRIWRTTYIQIKMKRDGSEEQDLYSNQAKSERI